MGYLWVDPMVSLHILVARLFAAAKTRHSFCNGPKKHCTPVAVSFMSLGHEGDLLAFPELDTPFRVPTDFAGASPLRGPKCTENVFIKSGCGDR